MLIKEINANEFQDFADHEKVVSCFDPDSGLRAFIAVHSTRLGPALGGCRMFSYATEDQAIADVLRLSRGMTYKSALAGLPLGGGKAVIIGNPHTDKTPALLNAMGRFVDSLNGSYITAEDSGTNVSDLKQMAMVTGYVSGIHSKAKGDHEESGDPSPVTAYGVFQGIKAMLRAHRGTDSLRNIRVNVQGVGNVGRHLVDLLVDSGAWINAADISTYNLDLAARHGRVRVVSNERLLSMSADVFAPCAMGGVLNKENILKLNSPIVAGAANNQLEDKTCGALLHQRGISYAPDYVINAGGIIDIHYERAGYDYAKVKAHVEGIGRQLSLICRKSRDQNMPTATVAEKLAEEIIWERKLVA